MSGECFQWKRCEPAYKLRGDRQEGACDYRVDDARLREAGGDGINSPASALCSGGGLTTGAGQRCVGRTDSSCLWSSFLFLSEVKNQDLEGDACNAQ